MKLPYRSIPLKSTRTTSCLHTRHHLVRNYAPTRNNVIIWPNCAQTHNTYISIYSWHVFSALHYTHALLSGLAIEHISCEIGLGKVQKIIFSSRLSLWLNPRTISSKYAAPHPYIKMHKASFLNILRIIVILASDATDMHAYYTYTNFFV